MISNDPVKVDNKNWRDLVPSTTKHFDACRDEALFFPQVDGVVEDEKYVSMVNCACCKSQENRQIFIKWGFIYSECLVCKHIYIQNRLKPEILFKFYAKSIADDLSLERQSNKNQNTYFSNLYSKYIEGLLNYVDQEVGNLLDVGCGLGAFLDFAKKKTRLNLFGSEFSEAAFDKLSKLLGDNFFFKMEIGEIEQKINEKFDIITFWGVLEHVIDPLGNLISAGNLLKPQGRILVLVPNFHSRAMQILGTNNPTLNPREHIQYFSKTSMEKCVKMASLEIENRF
jgi:2-polyprenyl-3-methyl-5-hydroxy-6-metoxy-1,4-benzoquinol methylase